MAKEEKTADAAESAPPKKSKKLLIIILAAVLIIVLGGGGAAYFLLKKGDDAAEDEEVATEKEKPKKKKGEKEAPPVYVQLEPFTSNLKPETGEQYISVTMQLRVEDAAAAEKMKHYMPEIRHEVLLILSDKKPSELNAREGKTALIDEIREKINSIIEPTPPAKGKKPPAASEGPVKAVVFTNFIVQ